MSPAMNTMLLFQSRHASHLLELPTGLHGGLEVTYRKGAASLLSGTSPCPCSAGNEELHRELRRVQLHRHEWSSENAPPSPRHTRQVGRGKHNSDATASEEVVAGHHARVRHRRRKEQHRGTNGETCRAEGKEKEEHSTTSDTTSARFTN